MQAENNSIALLVQLRSDDRGSLSWIGLVLLTLITAMGAIVGLTTFRDHTLQQFGDVAVGLRSLRQAYKYSVGIDGNNNGSFGDPEDCLLEGSFSDVVDLLDEPDTAPACMQLNVAPTNES